MWKGTTNPTVFSRQADAAFGLGGLGVRGGPAVGLRGAHAVLRRLQPGVPGPSAGAPEERPIRFGGGGEWLADVFFSGSLLPFFGVCVCVFHVFRGGGGGVIFTANTGSNDSAQASTRLRGPAIRVPQSAPPFVRFESCNINFWPSYEFAWGQ